MTSFADLPALAARVVAAGDHLAFRSAGASFSCGCPGWGTQPHHDPDCPVVVIDECLRGVGVVTDQIASILTDTAQTSVAEVCAVMNRLPDGLLPAAALGATLALVGAARLFVNVEARQAGLLHDLQEPIVETYAVCYRICSDPRVALGPQTAARLLLSPHRQADLHRLRANVDVGTGPMPELVELGLPQLVTAVLDAISHLVEALTTDVEVSLPLGQLAVDGFNLLAGLPSPVRAEFRTPGLESQPSPE